MTSRINLDCPVGGADDKQVRNKVFAEARNVYVASNFANKFRHYPKNVKPFYWQGKYDGTNIKQDGTAAINIHYIKHPMW